MSKKIQPLGDRILVEPIDDEDVVKGGIVIPDSAKEKPQRAKVTALGTGARDDEGKKIPFEVKVGDVVLMSKYGGTEVNVADRTFKILGATDVLAVLD